MEFRHMRFAPGPLVLPLLLLSSPVLAASQDNDVAWDGPFSDTTAQFVSPMSPKAGDTVRLRLRTWANDITGAECLVTIVGAAGSGRYPMQRESDPGSNPVEYWRCEVNIPQGATEIYYRFALTDGTDTDYYDAGTPQDNWTIRGMNEENRGFYDFRLYLGFETPAWSHGAVFYQIFPDRFADGDSANNRLYPEDCYWYLDFAPASSEAAECAQYTVPTVPANYQKNCEIHTDWNERPNGGPCDYFGGDLKGIQDRLQYIKNLGVDALYLNPVFRSPSNHKYDTIDYQLVDPRFGGLAALDSLTQAVHQQQMKIIVDGVFNHVSDLGKFYNVWQNYSYNPGSQQATGEDVFSQTCGAWEQLFLTSQQQCTSEWNSWFRIWIGVDMWDVDRDNDRTEAAAHTCGWAGLGFMPEIDYHDPNTSPNSAPRQWLYGGTSASNPTAARNSISGQWLADGVHLTEGLDGWRLDVPDNAGYFNQPTGCSKVAEDPTIWQGFRTAVKTVGADKYISGEIWQDASAVNGPAGDWFRARTYDAVMNYRYFAHPVSCFLTGVGAHDEVSECQEPFFAGLTLGAGNSVDVYDAHLANERRVYPAAAYLANQNLLSSHDSTRFINRADGDFRKLRLAFLMQMTQTGAPMIYYGDEIAVEGENNEQGRATMPWQRLNDSSSEQMKVHQHVDKLTCLRKTYSALRTGSFVTLHTHNTNRTYGFGRFTDSEALAVIINASDRAQNVAFSPARLGVNSSSYTDVLTGQVYNLQSNQLQLNVTAHSGAILVPTGLVKTENCPNGGMMGTNQVPVARAGADLRVETGKTVRLDGSNSSDPDGDSLSFVWTDAQDQQVGTEARVALDNLAVGNHTFKLTVSDGKLSAEDSVNVEVYDGNTMPMDAPVAKAGADQEITLGASVTLDGSASTDPLNRPLTYKWSHASGSLLGNEAKVTVHDLSVGAWVFNLEVTAGGVTSMDQVQVRVKAPTSKPGNPNPTMPTQPAPKDGCRCASQGSTELPSFGFLALMGLVFLLPRWRR